MPYDFNGPPDPRNVIPPFLPPDAYVDENGAVQMPYVPGREPVFSEAAWSEPVNSPMSRIGLAFADNPVRYHPTGQPGDFFTALLASAANSYGTSAQRADRERQGRNAFVASTNRQANDLNSRMDRLQYTQEQLRQRANLAAQRKADLEAKRAADRLALKQTPGAPRPVTVGSSGGRSLLSDNGVMVAATRYAKDGTLPTRINEYDKARIVNKAAEMNPTIDIAANAAGYKGNVSSLGALQKQYDFYKSFARTVKSNAVVLRDAMKKIRNTNSPLLNRPLREIDTKALGSEEMAAYNAAKQVVIPEFSRLLTASPTMAGTMTDTARHEIESILDGGYTLAQMEAALKVLEGDSEARIGSSQSQIDEINSRIRKSPFPAAAPSDSVMMKAPNGQVSPVPRNRVEFYKSKGAVEVSGGR